MIRLRRKGPAAPHLEWLLVIGLCGENVEGSFEEAVACLEQLFMDG
ncbi:MAG TPA: hypothetical protein VGN80_15325 [Devosiaceae bacterium]|jgi:hypothetical protein|nr:hypothetical protein [Devosiaceae bacterium]